MVFSSVKKEFYVKLWKLGPQPRQHRYNTTAILEPGKEVPSPLTQLFLDINTNHPTKRSKYIKNWLTYPKLIAHWQFLPSPRESMIDTNRGRLVLISVKRGRKCGSGRSVRLASNTKDDAAAQEIAKNKIYPAVNVLRLLKAKSASQAIKLKHDSRLYILKVMILTRSVWFLFDLWCGIGWLYHCIHVLMQNLTTMLLIRMVGSNAINAPI